MKDQYGLEIPEDLVRLTGEPGRYNADALRIIDNAHWYLVRAASGNETLAVSYKETLGLIDAPLEEPLASVTRVDRALHRFDDGAFYTA